MIRAEKGRQTLEIEKKEKGWLTRVHRLFSLKLLYHVSKNFLLDQFAIKKIILSFSLSPSSPVINDGEGDLINIEAKVILVWDWHLRYQKFMMILELWSILREFSPYYKLLCRSHIHQHLMVHNRVVDNDLNRRDGCFDIYDDKLNDDSCLMKSYYLHLKCLLRIQYT